MGIKADLFGINPHGTLNGLFVGFAGFVHPAKGKMLSPSLESEIVEAGKLFGIVFILVQRSLPDPRLEAP
ncbi:hypothetical protein NAI45_12120, partial [Francisella tularensis subsp. holarctica]|nr:hypothetical protein [Francisella tularensis subsp. holarctica]